MTEFISMNFQLNSTTWTYAFFKSREIVSGYILQERVWLNPHKHPPKLYVEFFRFNDYNSFITLEYRRDEVYILTLQNLFLSLLTRLKLLHVNVKIRTLSKGKGNSCWNNSRPIWRGVGVQGAGVPPDFNTLRQAWIQWY